MDTSELKLTSAPLRGERLSADGVTFVVDCYNANPDSVISGLESFARIKNGARRIIVLGDMLELGNSSEKYHREVGRSLKSLSFDLVVLVGPQSRFTADETLSAGVEHHKVRHVVSASIGADMLANELRDGDLVYVKGSRGIGLEAVVRRWTDRKGKV